MNQTPTLFMILKWDALHSDVPAFIYNHLQVIAPVLISSSNPEKFLSLLILDIFPAIVETNKSCLENVIENDRYKIQFTSPPDLNCRCCY